MDNNLGLVFPGATLHFRSLKERQEREEGWSCLLQVMRGLARHHSSSPSFPGRAADWGLWGPGDGGTGGEAVHFTIFTWTVFF